MIMGYIAVRCTLLLSPDVETILGSYNSMVYAKADVIETFVYRSGVAQSQYSFGSALWVIKTFAQLAINIVIYFLLARFFPDFLWEKII
jgi:putative aldouronate transport system permease protein